MRLFTYIFVLPIMGLCVLAGPLRAGESATPFSADQITDTTLKDAVIQHSPHYDYLVRADQVRAFVEAYQSVHNGVEPALTADDRVLLGQATPSYVVTSPQVIYYTPPPVYYQPSRPGFSFGISIGNSGWNRPGWHRPGGYRPGWNRPGGYRPGWNSPGGWNRPPHGGWSGGHRPGGPGGPGRPPPPSPR